MQLLDLVIIVPAVNEVRELNDCYKTFMFSNSYIGLSGQSWKLWLGALMLGVGVFLIVLALTPSFQSRPSIGAVLILGGVGLSALSLLWACLSVRCRSCGAPLVWKAMREQTHDKWLNFLLTNKMCPYCQDNVGESNE
jgi:hypothetical protein